MEQKDLSVEELAEWLRNLSNIPKKSIRKETLFDILGIKHLEKHWSYVYLYFFNPKASHGMYRLFVDTLQEIICKKTKKQALSLASFSVLREEAVKDEKGNLKYIDLLLQNDNEAIIIENKVYASLYNRLDLYWRKPGVPEENKRGVVLSLWRTKPTHHGFINITHEEFAKAIERNLPPYFMSAQPKSLILLQDFIQNIYNITHSMNKEELKFYFQHGNREIINRLAEIRTNVIKHIKQTIENKELLEPKFKKQGWSLSVKTKEKEKYVYYTFKDASEKMMLTLMYDSLWNYDKNGCRIQMFLELQNDMINFVKDHAEELRALEVVSDGNNIPTLWWHYKKYDIPFTPDELSEENCIAQKIIEAIKNSNFYEVGKTIIDLWKNSKH